MNQELYRFHRAVFIAYVSFAIFMALIGVRELLSNHSEEASLGLVGIGLLPVGFLHYYAAKGVRSGKSWGRTMSRIIASIMLIGFPLGTAFGIYIFTYTGKKWQSENGTSQAGTPEVPLPALAHTANSPDILRAKHTQPNQYHAWYTAGRLLASHRKRLVLAVAAVLYVVSALYAPWTAKGTAQVLQLLVESNISLTTYGPIFSPPDCAIISNGFPCRYELNVSLLLVEWLFIGVLAVIAWLWSKS